MSDHSEYDMIEDMGTNADVIDRVKRLSESQLRTLNKRSGVPLATLIKIRYGVTSDPRGSTLDGIKDGLLKTSDLPQKNRKRNDK